MNTNNNFDVKYTVRIYNEATGLELANQYERHKDRYKTKNEFLTEIIEIGLKANRKSKTGMKRVAVDNEENEIYQLLLEIFKHISMQFRKMYIDLNVLQRLIASEYNMLLALNNEERLFDKKIEDGFYDDLPPRFAGIIEDLQRRYGLS